LGLEPQDAEDASLELENSMGMLDEKISASNVDPWSDVIS
jgi:hypothetical protein